VKQGRDREAVQGASGISCDLCRHRVGVGLEGLSEGETDFMLRFKAGHDFAPAGSWIGGSASGARFLFTLYSGWALRCRADRGGRGQPAGIALPGDLLGIETMIGTAPDLKVRALTDVTYCRFDPARWRELLAVPSLAERIVRIEALARIETEDRLLAAGRSATAAVCYFFHSLFGGLSQRKLVRDNSFGLPLSLSLVAETLGLTPVHLRRILRRLDADAILRIADHRVHVLDSGRLALLAGSPSSQGGNKPLI
jgi:CRP/FNR family transcriptional regulator